MNFSREQVRMLHARTHRYKQRAVGQHVAVSQQQREKKMTVRRLTVEPSISAPTGTVPRRSPRLSSSEHAVARVCVLLEY